MLCPIPTSRFGRVSPYQLVALDPTGARNTAELEGIIMAELDAVNTADAATQYKSVPTIPCAVSAAGSAAEEAACHFGRSWERGTMTSTSCWPAVFGTLPRLLCPSRRGACAMLLDVLPILLII